jgi:hypothetical protein
MTRISVRVGLPTLQYEREFVARSLPDLRGYQYQYLVVLEPDAAQRTATSKPGIEKLVFETEADLLADVCHDFEIPMGVSRCSVRFYRNGFSFGCWDLMRRNDGGCGTWHLVQ